MQAACIPVLKEISHFLDIYQLCWKQDGDSHAWFTLCMHPTKAAGSGGPLLAGFLRLSTQAQAALKDTVKGKYPTKSGLSDWF